MHVTQWRYAHDAFGDEASAESGISFKEAGDLCVQADKDDADINVIMRRFGRGAPLVGAKIPPTYGDFTGVGDYQAALERLRETQEQFMTLPASIRARFRNDPEGLVKYLADPANEVEAADLGFFTPEKTKAVRAAARVAELERARVMVEAADKAAGVAKPVAPVSS